MNTVTKSISSFVVAGIALLGFTIFMGVWYTIDQGDLGVVLRNGKVVTTAEPGLNFKAPIIDSVTEFSIRTQKMQYDDIMALSKDLQKAHIDVAINYQVDPAKVVEVYTKLGTTYNERVIIPALMDAVKATFGQFNAQSAINQRAVMSQSMTDTLSTELSRYGILVHAVQVQDVDFSSEFIRTVEDRMKAEIEVEKRQQLLEQEKIQADIVRTNAQGKADARVAAAEAEAKAITLRGDAEATAIEAKGEALRDNPDLVRLIQAERWNGALPTMVPPNGTVPFLELNK